MKNYILLGASIIALVYILIDRSNFDNMVQGIAIGVGIGLMPVISYLVFGILLKMDIVPVLSILPIVAFGLLIELELIIIFMVSASGWVMLGALMGTALLSVFTDIAHYLDDDIELF